MMRIVLLSLVFLGIFAAGIGLVALTTPSHAAGPCDPRVQSC